MIGIDKVTDPAHHFAGRETVACCAAGVVFNIQHAGQSDTIAGPAAAVGDEVFCLSCAGAGVGMREVVPTPDEAGVCCADVVIGEG